MEEGTTTTIKEAGEVGEKDREIERGRGTVVHGNMRGEDNFIETDGGTLHSQRSLILSDR